VTAPVLDLALARLAAIEDMLLDFRRDVHRHPELSFAEHRTTANVADALTDAGVKVTLLPGSGLVADLGAEHAAYRIAGRPRSLAAGADPPACLGGACGPRVRSTSVTVCLGAALALVSVRTTWSAAGWAFESLNAEVSPAVRCRSAQSEWLDGVDGSMPSTVTPPRRQEHRPARRPADPAADRVTVRLSTRWSRRGPNSPGPGLRLGKVITEVPAALGRRVDPRSSASLVWGTVEAGHAANVIPESGSVSGTLRVLDAGAWDNAGALVEELVSSAVAPYGVQMAIEHIRGVPPVVNAPEAVDLLTDAAKRVGVDPVPTEQSMGGEDFAWYLTKVPGAMARLSTRMPGGPTFDLHQGDLVMNGPA
jgi:amidohydrolase